MIGVPSTLYFVMHRLLRPYYRFRRWLSPIPRSPEPSGEDDAYRLKLVPAALLTRRYRQVLQLLKKWDAVPVGDYAEFGVYNGTSLICMHDALRSLGISGRRLTGFDSFQGLPPGSDLEDGGVWRVGQFCCPEAVAQANIEGAGVPPELFDLVAGWYSETLEKNPYPLNPKTISVVMIDSDTHRSATLALEYIRPKLKDVAVIFFDDWKLNNLDISDMGEYLACRQFLDKHAELRASFVRGYNRKSIGMLVQRLAP